MDLDPWLASRHHAVLITIRKDGSPQSSNVSFTYADGVARVSVTDDRAKTRNLLRDPRAVLHVLGDSFWQYAACVVTAELGPVSTEPGDEAGQELLEVYTLIAGKSPEDEADYLAAMVADQRRVLRLTVVSHTGNGL